MWRKILVRIVFGAVGLIVVVVGLALGFRAYMQHRNSAVLALRTPNAIDEGGYITIGGIPQWLQIRGEDRDNPILLFLHGGPGASTLPLSGGWRPWEKYFTVVQWDERGTGRSLRKSGFAIGPTLTIPQMTQDGIEVAEYLRSHLHQDKMILVGHSFGSILGVQIVKQRPDLFYAYVGTGQVIGWKTFARQSELTVSRLRDLAKTAGNDAALRDLSVIESLPFNNPEKAAVIRKWSGTLHLPSIQSMNRPLVIPPPFMPEFSVVDWFYFILGRGFSALKLAPSVSQSDLTGLGLEFRVPVFFFEGAFDFVTPIEPVEQYFENISAPHKELIVFDGADHFLPLDRPTEFLQELRARVRPIVVGDRGAE